MSVVALYDGRRKKIAVTAGTYMSDVLKKACEGFGLDNIERLELRHKDKVVDLSIPFRLSGVSVNAVLEVKEVANAAQSDVRVGIQLVDGRRVQGSFRPSTPVIEILVQLGIPTDITLNFMRRDLNPHEFSSVTLQQLGLLTGSAMFRVKATPPPSSASVAPVAPSPQTTSSSVNSIPSARPSNTETISPGTTTVALPRPSVEHVITADDVDMQDATALAPPTVLSSYDALQLVRNTCFDAVSTEVVLTLMKIVCNILSKPDEPKVRSIRAANPKFHDAVGKHQGGVMFLQSLGFQQLTNEGDGSSTSHFVLPEDADTALLRRGLALLQDQADDLRLPPTSRPSVVVPAASPVEFDAYKAVITRVQAQPRGLSVTEMRLEDLKRKEEALLAMIHIPARNPRVFFPHERNFRTLAMRELDDMQKKTVFQSTVLRIRFPDQVTLQATFHPKETLAAVVLHLNESLADSGRRSFSLYVTPPRQTLALDGSATLGTLYYPAAQTLDDKSNKVAKLNPAAPPHTTKAKASKPSWFKL
ncbi:hypothetical protein B5M09_001250 [Aphanomyces astaci]|uniref:UBX domain-containing protein n=1 Tax=Aphanomyces astaci TaxID=112090 RepID=A0A3R7YKV7_APHAT|nr:hypothetical protein B5M09_001250 [Aphanomyces astaci]